MKIPPTGISVASVAEELELPLSKAHAALNDLIIKKHLAPDPNRHGWFIPEPADGFKFRQHAAKKPIATRPDKCAFCGEEFISTCNKEHVWKLYCSSNCANSGRMRKMSKLANTWRPCPICGAEYRGVAPSCHDKKCRNAMMGRDE